MKALYRIIGVLFAVIGGLFLKMRGDKYKRQAEKSKMTKKQVQAYVNKPKNRDEVVDRLRKRGL